MTGLDPVYRTHDGEIIKDSRDGNSSVVDAAVQTDHNGYRLPTSNEWEMAARWKDDEQSTDGSILVGGRYWTPGDYASGATTDHTNTTGTKGVAWYYTSLVMEGWDIIKTQNVGTKLPNALGLYDMSGNVWEWTYDWHPNWVGHTRILRGGSYDDMSNHLQIGRFSSAAMDVFSSEKGFRIVRNKEESSEPMVISHDSGDAILKTIVFG